MRQGRTLLIRLTSAVLPLKDAGSLTVWGSLDGRPLGFLREGNTLWTLAGIEPWATPGSHTLQLFSSDASGKRGEATVTVEVAPTDFPLEAVSLEPATAALLRPEVLNEENALLGPVMSRVNLVRHWEGFFSLPTRGEVSSPFGARRSYNNAPLSGHHLGLDLSADSGTPVVAANHGVVVLARVLQVRGNAVVVDHGMGLFTAYFHLSHLAVAEGQPVRKGELIGAVGATGLATGPHLHWEMRIGGVPVEPLEWVERAITP